MPVLCKDVFPVSERAERGGAAGRVSTAHAFECAKIASDQVRAHAPRGRACKMSCWIEQARSQRSLTAGVNADVHHAEVVVCVLQTAGVLRRAVRGAQVRDYYSRTRSRTRTRACTCEYSVALRITVGTGMWNHERPSGPVWLAMELARWSCGGESMSHEP